MTRSGAALPRYDPIGYRPFTFLAQNSELVAQAAQAANISHPLLSGFRVNRRVRAEPKDLRANGWGNESRRLRYPADRQSFIFNPIEILGVAVGLRLCAKATDDQREWFSNTILRGLKVGQFRTQVSLLAAMTALRYLDEAKATAAGTQKIDASDLATPELVLACGIDLGFERQAELPHKQLQSDLISRLLSETIRAADAAESSAT